MLSVPFIYFSVLSVYMYSKRKKVDLPIAICILYATSGLIGLFMGDAGYLVKNYEISFFAAFSYCALLSLSLYPVARFSHLRIERICRVKNEKFLKGLSWTAIIWFLVYACASWGQFKGVLTGDMLALRTAIYQGTADDSFILSVPGPIRLLLTALSYVFGCPWIMIFLAFYSLLIQKLPFYYFVFFLVSSLSSPWGAVLGVDRSAIAAYLLSFAGVLVFFWPFMQKKIKKWVLILVVVLVGALIAYLGAITLARFAGAAGDDIDGVNNSLAFYLGHSYIYFCYYFDTFNNPYKMSNLILPFTNKFLFGDELLGGMRINDFLESKLGMEFGYFYTFVGQIQITAGHFVAILFCVIIFIMATRSLGRIKGKVATPLYAFQYYFYASFMLLGLFSYYYQSPTINASVVFFFVIFRIMGFERNSIKIDAARFNKQFKPLKTPKSLIP